MVKYFIDSFAIPSLVKILEDNERSEEILIDSFSHFDESILFINETAFFRKFGHDQLAKSIISDLTKGGHLDFKRKGLAPYSILKYSENFIENLSKFAKNKTNAYLMENLKEAINREAEVIVSDIRLLPIYNDFLIDYEITPASLQDTKSFSPPQIISLSEFLRRFGITNIPIPEEPVEMNYMTNSQNTGFSRSMLEKYIDGFLEGVEQPRKKYLTVRYNHFVEKFTKEKPNANLDTILTKLRTVMKKDIIRKLKKQLAIQPDLIENLRGTELDIEGYLAEAKKELLQEAKKTKIQAGRQTLMDAMEKYPYNWCPICGRVKRRDVFPCKCESQENKLSIPKLLNISPDLEEFFATGDIPNIIAELRGRKVFLDFSTLDMLQNFFIKHSDFPSIFKMLALNAKLYYDTRFFLTTSPTAQKRPKYDRGAEDLYFEIDEIWNSSDLKYSEAFNREFFKLISLNIQLSSDFNIRGIFVFVNEASDFAKVLEPMGIGYIFSQKIEHQLVRIGSVVITRLSMYEKHIEILIDVDDSIFGSEFPFNEQFLVKGRGSKGENLQSCDSCGFLNPVGETRCKKCGKSLERSDTDTSLRVFHYVDFEIAPFFAFSRVKYSQKFSDSPLISPDFFAGPPPANFLLDKSTINFLIDFYYNNGEIPLPVKYIAIWLRRYNKSLFFDCSPDVRQILINNPEFSRAFLEILTLNCDYNYGGDTYGSYGELNFHPFRNVLGIEASNTTLRKLGIDFLVTVWDNTNPNDSSKIDIGSLIRTIQNLQLIDEDIRYLPPDEFYLDPLATYYVEESLGVNEILSTQLVLKKIGLPWQFKGRLSLIIPELIELT